MLQTGSLALGFAGAQSSGTTLTLRGSPTDQAIVSLHDCSGCGIAGHTFDFGTGGANVDKVFLVRNTGPSSAGLTGGAVSAPFSFTGGAFPGGSGTARLDDGSTAPFCGVSLGGGAACAISVTYSGASTSSGTVVLDVTGAYATTAQRSVRGTRTARALVTVSEHAGWFGCGDSSCTAAQVGSIGAGMTVTRDFVVSNRGALDVDVLGMAAPLPLPFALGGGGSFPGGAGSASVDGVSYPFCATTLAAGAQCLVRVAFSPGSAGSFPASLELSYQDTGGTMNAIRSIFGQAF